MTQPKSESETQCPGCGRYVLPHNYTDWSCRDCARRYPPSLLKACTDSFDYALGLRSGAVIVFGEARIHGDYVTLLTGAAGSSSHPEVSGIETPDNSVTTSRFTFERGIDIRIDEIAWCADAPWGS